MKYWRHHRIRGWREYGAIALFFGVVLVCALFLVSALVLTSPKQTLGITFSDKYAETIGLNPDEAFAAMLDDLGVRDVRIPVYWSAVETSAGQYDFSRVDRLLEIASSRGASVTLAIGVKVPRWPECFIPSFYDANDQAFDGHVLRFIQALVTHTRHNENVVRWQVENEPFFPYGNCPAPSLDRLRNEVALVRALDDRPIMMTVSGEQESWLSVASMADIVGVSMYRFAYQAHIGPIAFPHPAWYYRVHAWLTRLFVEDVVISELQMEPWFTGNPQESGTIDVPFDARDFVDHLQFAKESGLSEVLLWGAEWWYYQHLHGDDSLWNAARDAFSTQ